MCPIMWYGLSVTCDRSMVFSAGPPVFSTNKTDRHDLTEILLKVATNTTPTPLFINLHILCNIFMHSLFIAYIIFVYPCFRFDCFNKRIMAAISFVIFTCDKVCQ